MIFFENDFSDDMGNILFGKGLSGDKISLMSPDNTLDGWLKKKWKIIDGKRCLIKGGSGATRQEPYNEMLTGRIMERLGIPCVSYSLITEDDYPLQRMRRFYYTSDRTCHGVVRNVKTPEWIGAAPIYDSGSSLWFSSPLPFIRANAKIPCKPFKKDHDEQINC